MGWTPPSGQSCPDPQFWADFCQDVSIPHGTLQSSTLEVKPLLVQPSWNKHSPGLEGVVCLHSVLQ